MESGDGGADGASSETSVRHLRNELNRLNNLIKGVLCKTYKNDLEFVWVQNSMLIGLLLTTKSSRYSILNTHEPVIKTGLDKDFHVSLCYINSRVGSCINDLVSPDHTLEKVLHYVTAPNISYSFKISMSYIVLLYCFNLVFSGRYELALKICMWFSQNSDVLFAEKAHQFSLSSDSDALPLLFSDMENWKRTPSDIICLFKIVSSSCLLITNDYLSLINLHTDDIPEVNNELLMLICYLKAVALFKVKSCDESIELLQKSLTLDPHNSMLVNIYLLLSLNFSQKGKHHLSIQMLKQCLRSSPSCHVAVLFLSFQYRLLNNQLAESQSLGLLQEIIGKHCMPKAVPSTLIYNFISNFMLSNIGITSSDVLLHLSLCHLELKKYEMAIENFERVTSPKELFSDTIFKDDLKSCSRYIDIMDTYRKIILSLVNSSKFSDVVEICEKVMKSITSKPIYEDDDTLTSEILLYKARGYYGLQEYSQALSTISCTIIQLENSCIHSQGKNMSAVSLEDQCFNLLCEAYGLKSKVLFKLEKFQESLHFSRLAYQIFPNDLSKALDLSLALASAGREVESALTWLQFRKFSVVDIDEGQIKSLIQNRTRELKYAHDEGKFFVRDVDCLEILLKQKSF